MQPSRVRCLIGTSSGAAPGRRVGRRRGRGMHGDARGGGVRREARAPLGAAATGGRQRTTAPPARAMWSVAYCGCRRSQAGLGVGVAPRAGQQDSGGRQGEGELEPGRQRARAKGGVARAL
jgi:hypothetical protein